MLYLDEKILKSFRFVLKNTMSDFTRNSSV